jgi:hypothetical protein
MQQAVHFEKFDYPFFCSVRIASRPVGMPRIPALAIRLRTPPNADTSAPLPQCDLRVVALSLWLDIGAQRRHYNDNKLGHCPRFRSLAARPDDCHYAADESH